MLEKIIYPIGIAAWLKTNTSLSNEQIAKFCSLDSIFVESLKVANMIKADPIKIGHLNQEEIKKGEANINYSLRNLLNIDQYLPKSKYKHMTKSDKLQKELWLKDILYKYPNKVNIEKAAKLFSTTKKYVEKLKEQVDDKSETLDPVRSGFCTQQDIENLLI